MLFFEKIYKNNCSKSLSFEFYLELWNAKFIDWCNQLFFARYLFLFFYVKYININFFLLAL